MKNILVIGGSYFAGRVFLETIAQQEEYAVYAFNRGNVPLRIDRVGHIAGDREIAEDVARIPELHWDGVVDFCGYTKEHMETLFNGLRGTVDHYVFISTTSVYAQDNPVPVAEDGATVTQPQPELGDFAAYGLQKMQAESELAGICRTREVKYTILRPAIIYGRYNYAPRESWFFDAVLQGKSLVVPGQAPARFSFVWVEDLARLIVTVIEHGSGESVIYNVAAPKPLGYAEFLESLEKACGCRPIVKKMAVKQIGLQGVTLPFPPDADLQYDGSRVARDLGFGYTPFAIGIKQTWQEYRNLRNAG